MTTGTANDQLLLSPADEEELTKLVNAVALSDHSLTLFAIAPESAPDHPVVQHLKTQLGELDEPLQFLTFFYSDNSLFNLLAELDSQSLPDSGRRVILAFGLEQLPTPRLKREMEQLNLGREAIFERNLVLVFWLNRESFLDEFRSRAPDFWDWRGKVATFETRHPLLYPYLEWLIAENSYLKMSGVMQVNRQVDIFLDQIYVSLQAERRQQVTATSIKSQQESLARVPTQLKSTSPSSRSDERNEPDCGLALEIDLEMGLQTVEIETSTTKTVTEKVDLSEVVRGQHPCSVILGAPGAGKTTLLRYLALHFAKAKRDGQETVRGGAAQEELGRTRLPIFFRIADYAERLEQHPNLGLLDYLVQFYRRWEDYFDGRSSLASVGRISPPFQGGMGGSSQGLSGERSPLTPLKKGGTEEDATDVPNLLLAQMQMGNCLILLDGLDEVFDQESRRQIVERINEFAEQFGNNKLLVTSRIAGYQEVKLSSRFLEFTITDMSDGQVSQFLHRWCRAVEHAQKPEATVEQQARDGDRQAQLILSDIQKNDGVKRLTANPLLLTILALIHRNGERLPERRVKLYELAVQTLTADWQLSKKLPNMQKVLLPEGEVVELLAPLAYWMHEEKPSGLVTHTEVKQQLAPKLAELRGESPDAPVVQQAVEEFLRRVRETTGLFVERAPDVYGFMHLTFEEYFAARHIADNEIRDILDLIEQHWHEPRWEEPILLALGYYGSHSPRLINRLVEQLFRGLEAYQPISSDVIKLRNAASTDALIAWARAENPNEVQEFHLKELLFAGQVVAQVGEVNANLRKKLIDKLVATTLTLEDDVVKQLLNLLRQIEQFNRQGEVVAALQTVTQNVTLSKEIRLKAQAAMLYVVCGEAETSLVDCVTELVQHMEPDLFCTLRELVDGVGEDMSPTLETARQQQLGEPVVQQALTFMTAMTYVREKHYDTAISLFQEITELSDRLLTPYIAWSLASCYQEKEEYDKANDFYQDCFEQLAHCIEPNEFLIYWRNRGVCQRLHGKYEQALDCFQQMLTIARELQKPEEEALALYHFGRTYKDWGKYTEGLAHYQQSRDLYQQLGKETDVANQWYWIGDCYREWGKYEQALEAQQQELTLRQRLDDQENIACAYWGLGRIYQVWGKYEQALAHYEQSRDLYQQLERPKNVASQWYNLAECYRNCGKYEQALECQLRCLEIRQTLDDLSLIALSYSQLGHIYQAWGKYAEAIAHLEQSRDLCQQLERPKNVAAQMSLLAVCYRNCNKYEQAVECQQQGLAISQATGDNLWIALAFQLLGQIYQAWGKYTQALAHHEQSRDLYQQLNKQTNVANQWYNLAVCYREWGKYEQALEAQQQDLTLRQRLDDQENIARAYWQLGRIYQAWGKYTQALAHHEQSRDLYQQLGKQTNVANQWYWMAVCYREWGKYQQALEAQQQDLTIHQHLDDQENIARAYYQLGRIYQAWGKYEQAIAHYEQSRDLYQQLGKEMDVANQWYWIGDCYKEQGKYELALRCQQQCLELRRLEENQSRVALSLHQLGRIYQAWGKYEEAIAHHEQSRDLYQQLERPKDVASRWYNLAECYREWGKYEQALECQQFCLEIRQTLDDLSLIASTYYQLGRIYQALGKYEEALAYHEQSRDLYQQLERPQGIAQQMWWLAGCYRDFNKCDQAIECQQQGLGIHQSFDDKFWIALDFWQLGTIYQAWGKYEQALTHYQQGRDLYQQLGKETNVASQWCWIGDCYREWGKYEQALEAQQQELTIRQRLDEPEKIADAYWRLGRIYQAWGKYEPALAYHEQSRDLYTTLDLQQEVANQLSSLATCYRELKDYTTAIEYYRNSFERHQALGHNESAARRLRQLSNTQRLLAKSCSRQEATALLQQAEHHLQQTIQLDTAGNYRKNLAYDHIALALLCAEHLGWLPEDDASVPNRIAQFEQSYTTGFACFTELGQAVDSAEKALDIARAYLEISPLENLDRAEALAHQSLQTFQDFNRRKLEASACKLLGEIYLARVHRQESGAIATASQFLTTSLHLYRELDLTEKAAEVEQLMTTISDREAVS